MDPNKGEAMNSKITILSVFLMLASIQDANAIETSLFSEIAFRQAIHEKQDFVVAFHSDSCGSCKVQKPNLEKALQEKPIDSVPGFMANFEATAAFRKQMEKPVRGPSTILVFKGGQEVSRILGETDKEKIHHLIAEALMKN